MGVPVEANQRQTAKKVDRGGHLCREANFHTGKKTLKAILNVVYGTRDLGNGLCIIRAIFFHTHPRSTQNVKVVEILKSCPI